MGNPTTGKKLTVPNQGTGAPVTLKPEQTHPPATIFRLSVETKDENVENSSTNRTATIFRLSGGTKDKIVVNGSTSKTATIFRLSGGTKDKIVVNGSTSKTATFSDYPVRQKT